MHILSAQIEEAVFQSGIFREFLIGVDLHGQLFLLYLGFNQAAETTRLLWADQSETLINGLEQSLDARLRPIRDQALWIAAEIHDLSDPAEFDSFLFGSLAATPQVAGIAIISLEGKSRRWGRDSNPAINEDWSQKPWMNDYLEQVKASRSPTRK